MSDTPTIIRPEDALTHKDAASSGTAAAAPHPEVKEEDRLENHLLWPAFLAEIAANRKADPERDQVQYPAE